MDIAKADIVISTAGRDRGKWFYVVDTEGAFVLIADGKSRKIEVPKRKKLKHVRRVTRTDSHTARKLLRGEVVLNSELRRDLASICHEFNSQNQGG